MNETTRPLKVAALGMEQRTYSTLQLFFRGPCKDSYVLVEEKQADISIIDMDGYQASNVLEGHKKLYPNRPAIVVSLSDKKSGGDAVYVRKPIEFSALTTALTQARAKLIKKIQDSNANADITHNSAISHKLNKSKKVPAVISEPPVVDNVVEQASVYRNNDHHKAIQFSNDNTDSQNAFKYNNDDQWKPVQISTNPSSLESLAESGDLEFALLSLNKINFNPHNPLLLKKIQFSPDQFLLGFFQEAYKIALEEQRNVRLAGPWRPITILHETREMWVEQNYRHLYALAAMPFSREEVSVSFLADEFEIEPSAVNKVQSIEPFLWKLALRTSRGRVPVGTNFEIPIQLIRWPNFTRTAVTPHALRIAALWSKQPTSLLETADVLSIPLQYVFIFYSAVISLELVTLAAQQNNNKAVPSLVKQHKHRNVFQILINKLRIA